MLIDILYNDNSIVVCIKPSGVLSTDEPGGMPELLRNQLHLGDDKIYTVHRLDRVVGGLMVYAVDSCSASLLSKQITDGSFEKKYFAVVHGCPESSSGTMEDLLFRDASKNMTYVVNRPRKGVKKAVLEYNVLKKSNNLTLVEIKLITGRTHQIRTQFSSRKMPLFGDRKYGASSDNCDIALWSKYLKFTHPSSGELMEFNELPGNNYPWDLFEGYYSSRLTNNIPSAACIYAKQCDGCKYINIPYEKSLILKQEKLISLLGDYCKIDPIIGMENPYNYRGKVHAAFGYDKKGNIISGLYKDSSHRILPVDYCLIEDRKADEIVISIRRLLSSFKIQPFDEARNKGFLRHVLIRRSLSTGEIMVILVAVSEYFKSQRQFVDALVKQHPDISTVILSVNTRFTSVVLGNKFKTIYGKGYIEDVLLGKRFRISPSAFYQINNRQTELLYLKALEFADLKGNETVLDAYCGTGTIGICASEKSKQVIGVELNNDSIRDAIFNSSINGVKNCYFICDDSGKYISSLENKKAFDVVFIDPPRSGCDSVSIESIKKIEPSRLVYISCNPDTLAKDLSQLSKKYKIEKIQGVDMFPFTEHVETVCLMERHQ